MKKEIVVSGTFMEMLVVRYSTYLGQKEIARAQRKHVRKHYDTRKLTKELRKIHADLLTADDPAKIRKLRKRYLELREQIAQIREARDKDPVYQELKAKNRALREAILRLDEMVMAELRRLGYEVKPETDPSKVEAKIRELNPNTRDVPGESTDGVVVAEAKP